MGNSVDQVHGAVDQQRPWVHGGARAARTLGTAAPHRHVARECCGAQELTGVGWGGCGRARGRLTRA
jgi:hypothetical protein